MTKYETIAVGAFVVLVVADWVVRLLSWDSSGLGDGALFWVRLLFGAFGLFLGTFFMWGIIALVSAGLAWLVLAGTWRIVGSTSSGHPFHDRPGLHLGVGTCFFLLVCVGYLIQPGPFLVAFAMLSWVLDLVLAVPR